MNAFLQAQAALIAEAAALGADMTEAVKGGAGARLLPEGNAFLQLVEYIEYGSQPQEFQGVAKDPQPTMVLGFAVSGWAPNPAFDPAQPESPTNAAMVTYNNPDGTPYLLRLFPTAMSRNDKARAFLLFKAMNWKGTATHFAQLLGQKFIGKIVTYTSQTKGAKPRSIIDLKTILPPLDLMTRQPYQIADAADDMYRLFLWDKPTLDGWKSLHIAGEFEAKDGQPARSKNFVQEEILGAVDFPGSALEILLKTSGIAYSVPAPKPVAAAPAAPQMAAPAAPPAAPAAVPVAPAAIPVAAVPVPVAPSAAPAAVAPAAVPAMVPVAGVTTAAVTPAPAATVPDVPFDGGVPVSAPAVAPVVVAAPAMPAMPVIA